MVFETPLVMEPLPGDPEIDYTAYNFRAIIDAMFQAQGTVLSTDLLVAPRGAGANMSVDVAAGVAVIQGDSGTLQGKYLCRSTTTTNVTVPAAPGSGSRTHRIVAQLYDKQFDGNSHSPAYTWDIELLADTGSGEPAEPLNALTLGTVTVPSGTVSIVAGNINATIKALAIGRGAPARPIYSQQQSVPPINTTTSLTDFTIAQWPRLTFTVPPSGLVWVTLSADVGNSTDSTFNSRVQVLWRSTGGAGLSPITAPNVGQVSNWDLTFSQRILCTGTPGDVVTIIPQYAVGSAHGVGDTTLNGGSLVVEPVS